MFPYKNFNNITTLKEIINSIKEDITIVEINNFTFEIIFLNSYNEFFQIKKNKITKRKLSKKRYKYIKEFDNNHTIILDDFF